MFRLPWKICTLRRSKCWKGTTKVAVRALILFEWINFSNLWTSRIDSSCNKSICQKKKSGIIIAIHSFTCVLDCLWKFSNSIRSLSRCVSSWNSFPDHFQLVFCARTLPIHFWSVHLLSFRFRYDHGFLDFSHFWSLINYSWVMTLEDEVLMNLFTVQCLPKKTASESWTLSNYWWHVLWHEFYVDSTFIGKEIRTHALGRKIRAFLLALHHFILRIVKFARTFIGLQQDICIRDD